MVVAVTEVVVVAVVVVVVVAVLVGFVFLHPLKSPSSQAFNRLFI
jgi:hypothetical protein